MLVLGLVGMGIWAVTSAFTYEYGTEAEGTVAADVGEIGAEDPVNNPGVWTGRDATGRVIWVGTEEEWNELTAEARSAHQADLRNTWLYPSFAVALVGLGIVVFDRRRSPVGPARL